MWNCNNPYSEREDNLRRLGFRTYRAYLQSDLWQSIRERALKKAKRKCHRCGTPENLQIHHRVYDLPTLSGASLDGLTVACAKCHCRAEDPTNFSRTRYDRWQGASEFLLTPAPPDEAWAGKCAQWFRRHRTAFIQADSINPIEFVEAYRRRATPTDNIPRCLLCGRRGVNPTTPPKVVPAGYAFCGHHPWRQIRAAMGALSMSGLHDQIVSVDAIPDTAD